MRPTSTDNRARGWAIALASAAVLSTTAIFIRHLTLTFGIPALVLAFWRDLFACAALLPALALVRPSLLRVDRRNGPILAAGGGVLVLLAVGPTVVGFGLYNVSLTHLPASVVNLVVTTEPVFTGLLAYLLLAERWSAAQAAGAVTVLLGVVVLRLFCERSA